MSMPINVDPSSQFELFDDMFKLNTSDWTSIDDAGTGTNTANDVAGGEVSIVTAGADNDYHVMASTKKIFKFAAAKPLYFEARFSLTEAATNAANLILGVVSDTTGGNLKSNGGGPADTYDGAVIFKVDGTMTLQAETSAGSAQVTNASVCTFVSGRVYRVGFHFDPMDGTTGLVSFWVYDETAGALYNPTGHKIALSGLGAMNAVYGVKAGSSSAETIKVDYVRVLQAR